MAKVPFSKLDVKLNSREIVVNHETSKGENVQF